VERSGNVRIASKPEVGTWTKSHHFGQVADRSTIANRWDEKAGLRRDALSSQVIDALEAHEIRRRAFSSHLFSQLMCEGIRFHFATLHLSELGERNYTRRDWMKIRRYIYWSALAALLLLTSNGRAQDGLRGALSRFESPARLLQHTFSQQIAAADFDKDQRPDGAVLLNTGQTNGQNSFRIEVHLTAGTNTGFTFSSAESAISISALDVNADGAPDIVVQQTFTHKRLQVWLNDGHASFRKVNSDNYQAQTEGPTQFQAHPPGQYGSAIWLPAKVKVELAEARSTPLSAADNFGGHHLWPEVLLAHSAHCALNPPRGPPSIPSI
jgi:hypothetical protein